MSSVTSSTRPAPSGATLAERLDYYSAPTETGCREWTASTDGRAGYGKLRWAGHMRYAHRLAWELAHGPIPEGLEIRHRCDNPGCVNVEHLELGTHAENVRDSFDRGRAAPRGGEANNSARLDWPQVREIRRLHAEGAAGASLARRYGLSESQVSNIVNRRLWRES